MNQKDKLASRDYKRWLKQKKKADEKSLMDVSGWVEDVLSLIPKKRGDL